ncbi:MAG TPA: phage tail terminator-like protein, partial [Devosia sp.]|nr:phage tail terminator-like protein [Devosia sp.]
MARSEVVTAVRNRLEANWTHTDVFDENSEGSTPADGSPYLDVQFPFSTNERVTFGDPGNNVYREEGAFRLLLNVQRGSGGNTGRQWADELAALF